MSSAAKSRSGKPVGKSASQSSGKGPSHSSGRPQNNFPIVPSDLAPLFERGDSILVAFSGGPDSVALLHVLHELSHDLDLSITACYINHLIRPTEAEVEQRFCEAFCDNLEVPFVCATVDIPVFAKEQKKSVELAGREMRHHLLRQIADEEECDWIAFGHHADDQVETILFRIFRGTGPEGLVGMTAFHDDIVRPLLPFTRADILDYLTKNKLTYCVDDSNENESYTRNYIRHNLLPAIESRFPGARAAVLRLSEIVAEERAERQGEMDEIFKDVATLSPGGVLGIEIDKFNAQELGARRRFVRSVLNDADEFDVGVDFAGVERLIDIAALGRGGLSLPNDVAVSIERGVMYFHQGPKTELPERPLELEGDGALYIPELGAEILVKLVPKAPAKLQREPHGHKVYIDSAAVQGTLTVRSMRPADTFAPLGLGGEKKLGDFFTDRKVPVVLRGEIPLICDGEGILWVVGYEIADRVKLKTARESAKSAIWEMEILYDHEECDQSCDHGKAQD